MSDEPLLDPATEGRKGLDPQAKVCGHCIVWKPTHQDAEGRWVGGCRLMPHRGDFPGTAPICERFLPRGARIPTAPPPEPGRRRSRTLARTGPVVRRAADVRRPPDADADVDLGDLADMTRQELVDIIREALDEGPLPELASKWEGGTVILKPGNETQPKELPIDTLLRKIVSVRDNLRMLEAKINAHETLSHAEKLQLAGYITKSYGSLTTFNMLFRDEADRFRGSGG